MVWNQRPNLIFFIQHPCLIHMDQLSSPRAAAKENVLHLKNELWKLRVSSSDCRIFLSHKDLLSAVEMLETWGVFGYQFLVGAFLFCSCLEHDCTLHECLNPWELLDATKEWAAPGGDPGIARIGPARICLEPCWQCLSYLGSWEDLMGQESTALVQRKY